MSTAEKAARIEFRCATPADLPGVVALKRKVYGGRSFDHWQRRWNWQFVDHPRRNAAKFDSDFVLAHLEGRLVGGLGFMPAALSWKGRSVESAFGCDLFIDPDAQGHGLGKLLIDRIVSDYPDSLWMNFDLAGARHYERRKFTPIAPVNFLGLAADPGAMLRDRGRPGPAALVGWTAPMVSAAIRLRLRSFRFPPGIGAQDLDGFGEEFDRFSESLRDREVVRPRRDAAYLTWRYRQCPYGEHRVRAARRDGRLLGFTVYRAHDTAKGRMGVILELETDGTVPGLGEALAASAVLDLLRERATFIKSFATDRESRRLFRKLGFFDTRRTPYLYVAPGAVDRSGWPRDGGQWAMSMGDCDLDYS